MSLRLGNEDMDQSIVHKVLKPTTKEVNKLINRNYSSKIRSSKFSIRRSKWGGGGKRNDFIRREPK